MKEILTIFANAHVVIHVDMGELWPSCDCWYQVWIECAECGHQAGIANWDDMYMAIACAIEIRDLVTGSDVCHNCLGIRETPNGKLSEWN